MIDALWISLLGMATVFASLGAVLLVMMGLGRVFKPEPEEEAAEEKQEG